MPNFHGGIITAADQVLPVIRKGQAVDCSRMPDRSGNLFIMLQINDGDVNLFIR